MRTGFWEILVIVVLVLLLFGSAKIPQIMKNFAEGIKVFKKEIKPAEDDKPAAIPAAVKKAPARKAKPAAAKKPVAKKAPAKKPAVKKTSKKI
ncbi:MAG: twin-arginine translocase TatA/TatE family subunit [Rickettsiales bacterium]|jgi:TatA/E family protein of Tat protein translocase|nr:twin-arginine translocase TatA/TatE family subunit [Rickettsiales bacterium]